MREIVRGVYAIPGSPTSLVVVDNGRAWVVDPGKSDFNKYLERLGAKARGRGPHTRPS